LVPKAGGHDFSPESKPRTARALVIETGKPRTALCHPGFPFELK